MHGISEDILSVLRGVVPLLVISFLRKTLDTIYQSSLGHLGDVRMRSVRSFDHPYCFYRDESNRYSLCGELEPDQKAIIYSQEGNRDSFRW